MLGDVEMEGKLVTSQYFYNFTTNINLSLLHLQCRAREESKGTLGFMGPPHTVGERKKGAEHLNADDQLIHMGAGGLTLQVTGCGMQACGTYVVTQVS